jgi:hypothetical protein
VKKGGAVGPGLFFVNPCLDTIQAGHFHIIGIFELDTVSENFVYFSWRKFQVFVI